MNIPGCHRPSCKLIPVLFVALTFECCALCCEVHMGTRPTRIVQLDEEGCQCCRVASSGPA
jgi:hypothetical protein